MESRKKVLIFIDWYLPGFRSGGPVTSISNMVTQLADYYDFYIVTRNTDYQSDKPYDLPTDQWVKQSGALVQYLAESELSKKRIKSIIAELTPHTLYVNGVYSKFFTRIPVQLAKKVGVNKIIVAPKGMLSPEALRIKWVKKRLYFLWLSFNKLFEDVIFHATTAQEKEYVWLKFTGTVEVIPNLPKPIPTSRPKSVYYLGNELRLVSIARVAPEKNALLAIKCLGKVKGNVVMDWYGPVYSKDYMAKCYREIKKLPENVKFSFKPSIQSSVVNNVLANYHLFFLPTQSENFGHSIVEALTNGLPVIISQNTPWTDVSRFGAGFSVKNSVTDYTQVINELVRLHKDELETMRENAFNYIQAKVDLSSYVERYKSLFQ